ncbi:MAG: hypothetical protein JXA18_03520, partial [Chitinispirillaceae bacterium]|nr:hypothetical protein [Chitinispirillaceae bacterium]
MDIEIKEAKKDAFMMEVIMPQRLKRVSGVLLFTATMAFGWTTGGITVDVTESPMDIRVSTGGTTLVNITGFTFGTVKYTTASSVSSTDDALILTLSSNTS